MTRASFWIKDEQTETNIFLPPEKVEQYWVEIAVLNVTPLDLLDLPHPAALFSYLKMTLAFLQKKLVNLEWKWLVLWKFLTRHISSVDAFYLLHSYHHLGLSNKKTRSLLKVQIVHLLG